MISGHHTFFKLSPFKLWMILIALAVSCHSNDTEMNCPENQDSHTLILADSIAFPLDTNSNDHGTGFYYRQTADRSYFGLYKHMEHAVYIYDY